jgi:hypothetical protein
MKLRYVALTAIAVLSFGGIAGAIAQTAVAGEMSNMQPENPAMTKDKTGMFVAAEHPTQGMVRVINKNGKRYLQFDAAFKTDKGPDLHVILHRAATLPKGGLKQNDYVILSRLQKVSGSQRYAIPQNLNLANYRSIAVWCRQFNATFGYAPL